MEYAEPNTGTGDIHVSSSMIESNVRLCKYEPRYDKKMRKEELQLKWIRDVVLSYHNQ